MKYIKKEPVTVFKLTCKHPLVNHLWEYGGLSATPNSNEVIRTIAMILQDGTRHEFKDSGNGDAILEAEKFLRGLHIESKEE